MGSRRPDESILTPKRVGFWASEVQCGGADAESFPVYGACDIKLPKALTCTGGYFGVHDCWGSCSVMMD